MKKKAFTLAEVLITLGIIGVVAAMTIPTLMQKTNNRETVSKVKKIYNTVTSAMSLAVANYGTVDKWGLKLDVSDADAKLIAENLKPYLKITKDCDTDQTGCIYDGYYKKLNGQNHTSYNNSSYYKLILTDGVSVWFRSSDETCSKTSLCGSFIVDINGEKTPNTIGRDTFMFYIYNDRVIPQKVGDGSDCSLDGAGWSCASYIIENDNVDYLK